MRPQSEEVQRRLAAEREKGRMKALNSAFDQLRSKLKLTNGRKLTKIRTLRLAIGYIAELQQYLSNETTVNEPKCPYQNEQMIHSKSNSNETDQWSVSDENTVPEEPKNLDLLLQLRNYSTCTKPVPKSMESFIDS